MMFGLITGVSGNHDVLKLCDISLYEFWLKLLTKMKCQGWCLAWHMQEQWHTEFNLQDLVLLPQGMRSSLLFLLLLLTKQWPHAVTFFSSQPWLWCSSRDCLYLEVSHEKRSCSMAAPTTFHSTWTMINSASLYWCAWLWNSNLIFCLFVFFLFVLCE